MNGYALERDIRDAIEKNGGKALLFSVQTAPANRFKNKPARLVFSIEVQA